MELNQITIERVTTEAGVQYRLRQGRNVWIRATLDGLRALGVDVDHAQIVDHR